MNDQEILDRVVVAKREFGAKCSKYAGAITVEILMSALQENGFLVSARDIFIRGVPIEIDLLIPMPPATSKDRILYEPSEVRTVFEIKNTGSSGKHRSMPSDATSLRYSRQMAISLAFISP